MFESSLDRQLLPSSSGLGRPVLNRETQDRDLLGAPFSNGETMNYQIMQQVEGKEFIPAIDRLTNKPFVYSCPKEAARAARQLTQLRNAKFQPRPIEESSDGWMARERQRFVDGSYKLVVWIGQEWWDKNHNPDHFVHVSVKDPTRIAFTKNAKDGSSDIQTSMKPGKYLTEFFGKILTAEQIRDYAMQHSTKFETQELKFATTPEEIERVYKPSLGSSCFSGTKKANLYGSGDFAVAYIEDSKGNIKARSVCCPERKIYIRPYGDYKRLEKLLTDAGYNDTDYYSGPWKGLKLLKEHHWDDFYTDFGGRAVPHPTDNKYLVIE